MKRYPTDKKVQQTASKIAQQLWAGIEFKLAQQTSGKSAEILGSMDSDFRLLNSQLKNRTLVALVNLLKEEVSRA